MTNTIQNNEELYCGFETGNLEILQTAPQARLLNPNKCDIISASKHWKGQDL